MACLETLNTKQKHNLIPCLPSLHERHGTARHQWVLPCCCSDGWWGENDMKWRNVTNVPMS